MCDLRAISNHFLTYKLEFSQKKISHKKKEIINNAKKIIKEWYMIELDKKNGIFYIPFYLSFDTYNIFESNNIQLNNKQKQLKKFLYNKNFSLGLGIGLFNVIKIC